MLEGLKESDQVDEVEDHEDGASQGSADMDFSD